MTTDMHRGSTPAVTFHGHDAEAGHAGTNYHAHTSSNEMASFSHPTTTHTSTHTETIQQHPTQHSTMMQPMSNTMETSSRRNSYGDDAVINKTTQLYAATPRSACDSFTIRLSYVLGALGMLVGLTWLIVLLVTQGQDFGNGLLERNYDIALKPFLMQLPYFMACLSFVFMAGKRNTTLAWFLVTTSNFLVCVFWLMLIVPYFIQFAYNGDSNGDTACPDLTGESDVNGFQDTTRLCRLRKGAAALSCALIAIHFAWFLIGLVQTVRHWKTIIVLDAAYPSKQIWLLLLTVESCGLIIWAAGNLRLTYLGKNDTQIFSNQILWTSTYIVTLVTIVAMVMTAYAILDASKLYVGITFLFHLCAAMLLWSVFVYEARWSLEPSVGLGNNTPGTNVNGRANRVVAAGLGIVTGVETVFTVLFAIAYKVMPDLFLTQPNLTGPAAV